MPVALNNSIGKGFLSPRQHKWLVARSLGPSPLGTLKVHLVSFYRIRGIVTINTYLTIRYNNLLILHIIVVTCT